MRAVPASPHMLDPEPSTRVNAETPATGSGGIREVPRARVPEGSAGSPVTVSVPRQVTFDAPLETKLHAPVARKEWVKRQELVDYLAGAAARLLLIDAPAGFGKTTLVAQWRSSPGESRAFGWVSLDPGDNDPARLWRHVVWAVQRACPGFDADAVLSALRTRTPDFAGQLVPLLVNELVALPEPVVLVLDDYQVIKERSCHDHFAFLLLHLPPTVQVALITRSDPPLPLARLRAAGEIAEVRAHDLRFAPAPAAELVVAAAGVELSRPDLADLVDRTEGWAAGLYLAALSLRGHPSPSEFIREFTGNSRFIVDFLAEEVLGRQPAEIRHFLARTSILGRFCAPLCDAVVGSNNAAEIIDILERENLFVVPLDDTRQWFRYHRLFAQVLRGELARAEPDLLPALHERASAWHRRSGQADEAIRHLQAAGDVAGVVDFIARHWYAYVNSGRVATVRGWLNLLGTSTVSADPVAAHCAAWAAGLSGDRESLLRWLPIVEAGGHEGPLPDGVRSLRSSAALLKATFGFIGIGIGTMRDAAAEAVALETDPASPWYALARASYAAALYWSGDLAAAAEQARAAVAGTASISGSRLRALAFLSLIATEQGNLDAAGRYAHAACQIADGADSGLGGTPQTSLAYTAAAAVSAGRGRLSEARGELERLLQMRRSGFGISPWPGVEIMLRLAPVLFETGDRPGGVELLAETRQLLTSSPDGADALLARLDRLERRLVRPRREVTPTEPLTEREVAVLRLLRGSLSLREIGQRLSLSRNTIKSHTRAIYRKLGASTRLDAIAKGRDAGVL
jgi:LuxR family maltose regulon positive regulatory protein